MNLDTVKLQLNLLYLHIKAMEKETRGQTAVQTIIVVAATLFIGINIIAQIIAGISGLTGTANTTFIAVEGYMWTGVGFLGLGLLVLGAVYILRIIRQMS